ncbi:hypothetical protein [Pseudogulbenkiania subflava]|uniref:Uncharacterized protein n=1 Tax=Pseudogulbenkiania subflava DSM 22618 TaxID=1123014 RepID=A0A1Y6BEZ8_9NEIS|nr:hypothetical protein [Pseudogulbenkiania subflava]SMF06742.1 hypothetical protein SAMN02745746_01047 [Pseudogulbenkiania subflava DSM 22618]
MNSLISSLDSANSRTRRNSPGGVPPAPAATDLRSTPQAPAEPAVAGTATASGWRYSSQLNEQLTAAQRALGFVDGLTGQLEQLKTDLSQQLAQRRIDREGLEAKIGRFATTLVQRYAQSGGSVDGKLRFHLAADARQDFTVRGMDLDSLRSGPVETLALFSGERGTAAMSFNVGGDVSEDEIMRRLSRALAPSGIRPSINDDGQLGFSVDEAAWPAIRDRLAVRGGGVRFPSGQPQRVKTEAEPERLATGEWQVNDHAHVRQTLQRVVNALSQLRQAHSAIASAINQARDAIDQLSRMGEQNWAQEFVADFNARLNQAGDYRSFHDVIPALLGVSRYRVVSLLAL